MVGYGLRVAVTASNSAGSTTAHSPITERVLAIPPLNVELPSITGEFIVGNQLEAYPGTWAGNTSMSFTSPEYKYQSQLCDASGEHCEAIAAATGSSYAAPVEDIDATLRVVVTSRSPAGQAYASATSPASEPLSSATALTNTTAPRTPAPRGMVRR